MKTKNQRYTESINSHFAPVLPLLRDDSVTEVLINGPKTVFVERSGVLEKAEVEFADNEELMAAVRNLSQYCGKILDEKQPILEDRMPDGSRVEVVIAPIAQDGPCIAIRKFSKKTMGLADFCRYGSLDSQGRDVLEKLVAEGENVLVVGGTGSGKTSLLMALCLEIPKELRIVVIEDSREIEWSGGHVVYLTARLQQQKTDVPIRKLLQATLRMRPDRIVVGEIRGGEALDLIQAMTSGHGGCLGTLHASNPVDALHRLETMAMLHEVQLPLYALRSQVASAIGAIVEVKRCPDGRRVVHRVSTDICSGSEGYSWKEIYRR